MDGRFLLLLFYFALRDKICRDGEWGRRRSRRSTPSQKSKSFFSLSFFPISIEATPCPAQEGGRKEEEDLISKRAGKKEGRPMADDRRSPLLSRVCSRSLRPLAPPLSLDSVHLLHARMQCHERTNERTNVCTCDGSRRKERDRDRRGTCDGGRRAWVGRLGLCSVDGRWRWSLKCCPKKLVTLASVLSLHLFYLSPGGSPPAASTVTPFWRLLPTLCALERRPIWSHCQPFLLLPSLPPPSLSPSRSPPGRSE